MRRQAMTGLGWRVYGMITHAVAATTLPEPLRAQYGALLTLGHPALWRLGARAGRVVPPRLPRSLRGDPLAEIAFRRAARRERAEQRAAH